MPKHILTVDRFPWISLTLQLQEGPHLKVKFMDFQMCHASVLVMSDQSIHKIDQLSSE